MSGEIALVEQFVSYLRNERHFSPYTARCYGADLRQFAEYITSTRLSEGAEASEPAENEISDRMLAAERHADSWFPFTSG